MSEDVGEFRGGMIGDDAFGGAKDGDGAIGGVKDGADAGEYADIINLEHFHDAKRPYMSMRDRAGQFSPFKSLAAYHEEIDEAEKEAML